VSGDFFRELRNILDNEWIVIADACALFAGWCPLGDFDGGSFGGPNTVRQYKRIGTGEIEVPSEKDFAEMRMFQEKWIKSDFDIPHREHWVLYGDGVSHEVRVLDAFRVGLGWSDERINNLYDAAVDESIIPEAFPTVRTKTNVTVGLTGVTGTGEVGSVDPTPLFDLSDNEPTKPIVRLVWRFLKQARDAGQPKPNARAFTIWVHGTKPTEPLITIVYPVDGKGVRYHENSAPDEVTLYSMQNIRQTINDLLSKKK